MGEREEIERDVRRATQRYLERAHASDEDLHPETLDPEGLALEDALDRLAAWKLRASGNGKLEGRVDDALDRA